MTVGVVPRAMDQRPLQTRNPDLRGLKLLVIGAGRSGISAARFAVARGAQVIVCDRRPAEDLGPEREEARRSGFELLADGNPPTLTTDAELVVLSPGVPPGLELLREARRLEIPIWGEIELASRFCRGHVIAVTGSNGKSTVTTMVGAILRTSGLLGGLGGNLDEPFTQMLDQDRRDAWHALELSSFQLETTESLRPEIAVVLNLSADHLDRYASLADYARAKTRLLELQTEDGHAVLNADDPESDRFRSSVRAILHTFSTRGEVERGAFLRDDRLILRTSAGEDNLMPATELTLPGMHNVANALAAALACRLAGCSVEKIVLGLREYRPLDHRLELVQRIEGVAFYDDSKATNPSSTETALRAFDPRTVHLILGGRDKGADWVALVSLIKSRAKRVLLVGENARELESMLAPDVALESCGTIERAVSAGFSDADHGDVVLLSPGCASFDQYRNFEDRGEDFKRHVRSLTTRGGDNG